ncbi:MAG TPA: non-homologous end-joining DNA ligase [Bacillota bacterium]
MLPQTFQPMLATLAEPFDSEQFNYEIKWDGYRCLAFLDVTTRLLSRNGRDITAVFPDLSQINQRLHRPGCLLDGEIVALRNGKPSFAQLQQRAQLRNELLIKKAAKVTPVVYIAFDLIYHNHQPVFGKPWETRRRLLEETVLPGDELIISAYVEKRGRAYFEASIELGLEGVMAKKKGSLYFPGKRVKHWLKFKRKQSGPFVICGYLPSSHNEAAIASLVVGAYLYEKLQLFGLVGTGFNHSELQIFYHELSKIRTDRHPFPVVTPIPGICWLKPIVVCEVEYLELTDQGLLRHASFKRIRPDLKPEDCQFT